MSAGMAYEAMNNAEQAGNRLIVILNDNDMSIAPPVGGLSAYLARLISSSEYLGLRSLARRVAKKVSRRVYHDRKSTRLNSSHSCAPRMPSSACKKTTRTKNHTRPQQ